MRRTFAILLILGFSLLLSACNGTASGSVKPEPTETFASAAADETAEPTQEPAATSAPEQYYDDAAWFCPAQVAPSFDSPAIAINIATGEVLVACPDPLCTHSEGSETCFFNFNRDDTHVFAVEYLSEHIFFVADKKTDDGRVMKLYDYDIAANRIGEVYTYKFAESMVCLYKNGDTLFFTAITDEEDGGEDSEKTIGLFAYDPGEKKVTIIDDNARYALDSSSVAFYEDFYIFSAGYNEEEDRTVYCRRSYDGSGEEFFDTLPDGTPFEIFGWSLKSSGVFANTWGNGGVYFPDGEIKLVFPTDSATTYPVRYKDSVYFTTRGSAVVELGKNPYTGSVVRGYSYDNELYVMNKDGSYKHYSIDCEYHFIIAAVYENVLIGRIDYKLTKAGECIKGGDSDTYILPDFIRIDLETGETTVYDTSIRNGFIRDTFVCKVTLNEN